MHAIRMTTAAALVAAGIAGAAVPAGATAAGPLERVSVDSSGVEMSVYQHSSISADGRYVAFAAAAGNSWRIYVRDLRTGTSTLANVKADGTPADNRNGGTSFSMSGNGRYVAFATNEPGVVAWDTNSSKDVFVRDLEAGATTLASVRPDGSSTNTTSDFNHYSQHVLSDDGRFVVFYSNDRQLVAGDTNNYPDAFVRDLQAGTTTRVSVGNGGVQGDGQSGWQLSVISGDGRTVMFESGAKNLVDGGADTLYPEDIFVRDLGAGTTTRIAASTDDRYIDSGALSTDGRYAAYSTHYRPFTGGNQEADNVYLYNLRTDTATAVNVPASGGEPVGYSYFPAVSANGDVAFESQAANLVDGDTNDQTDIFVAPH
jgi:Tol biopolymer transport system component